MTQIQIKKSEKDAIQKEFAGFDIKVEFFTIERNEDLLLVRVYCDDPALMWKIGKFTGQAIEIDHFKNLIL